jgi:lycopene cyclase domain-containing protein
LNPHYTYLLILAVSLAGPLFLSFDKKVAFYQNWKYVFPAMIIPAAIYIAWDYWFTTLGIWSFNELYITGIYLFDLPIEEVLFFFVVPYCCLFIYECIRVYFSIQDGKLARIAWLGIALILLLAAVYYYNREYTFYTFCACGLFLLIILAVRRNLAGFNFKLFLIAYGVILIPFLVVNGFLTAIPVVQYNNLENLGTRIYTIPVEDLFYGMLLVAMNVVIFEALRTRSSYGRISSTPSHL